MTHENIQRKSVQIYPDGRLDTKNAEAYTGLSEKTLAMHRCKGTGPKFIKRGRIFYFLEDLDDWLNAAARVTTTAQARALKDTARLPRRGRQIRGQ